MAISHTNTAKWKCQVISIFPAKCNVACIPPLNGTQVFLTWISYMESDENRRVSRNLQRVGKGLLPFFDHLAMTKFLQHFVVPVCRYTDCGSSNPVPEAGLNPEQFCLLKHALEQLLKTCLGLRSSTATVHPNLTSYHRLNQSRQERYLSMNVLLPFSIQSLP